MKERGFTADFSLKQRPVRFLRVFSDALSMQEKGSIYETLRTDAMRDKEREQQEILEVGEMVEN